MTGHEEYSLDLADYVAGRLDAERARAVEVHLHDCQECRRWVGRVRRISDAVRDGGAVLFDAHPTTGRLRELALTDASPAAPEEIRHIESCASCSLEMGAWKRRQEERREARAARRQVHGEARSGGRRRPWASPALAAGMAAGLLIGGGLGYLARGLLVPRASEPPSVSNTRTPIATPSPDTAPPPGADPRSALMPDRLRRSMPTIRLMSFRGGGQVLSFDVEPDADFVTVLVQAAIPPDVPDDAAVRAEIRSRDGAGVWSSNEEPAGRLRRALEASDVFGYLVPATLLAPGSYELTIRRLDADSTELLVRIPFEIRRPG